MTNRSDRRCEWWRGAVFYQIYPLSFSDSDGDGYGDLEGIISKLDYLSTTLGVDSLWLSPFYRSPLKDWGYDISDHTDVDPIFGDLATARKLIDEAHSRGIRVIVDYVMNHSSDRHPWFLESRLSRVNPKRDWYVWRDSDADGGPPTNWVSVFSGPAWTFDDTTGQWYRHTYLPEQPDLNWRNLELVEAMMDVARFWLDAGVDGFRVDAAHQIMKDPQERNNPHVPHDYHHPFKGMGEYDDWVHLHDLGHSDVHDVHRAFQAVLDTYAQQPLSVGEIHIFDLPEWASYYGNGLDEFSMPFNLHLMAADWNASSVAEAIDAVYRYVPSSAWTNWTLGNHDEIRLASRLPEGHDRLAALLLLTLRGTPFLYYGDELGMKQAPAATEGGKDPWDEIDQSFSRDGARTPMQWSSGANAGFAPAESLPWLPIPDDYQTINVDTQLTEPTSMLNMYRRLLGIRRESDALRLGAFMMHPSSSDDVLVYRRSSDHQTVTVALNFSDERLTVPMASGQIIFSTDDPERSDRLHDELSLRRTEGVVVQHV